VTRLNIFMRVLLLLLLFVVTTTIPVLQPPTNKAPMRRPPPHMVPRSSSTSAYLRSHLLARVLLMLRRKNNFSWRRNRFRFRGPAARINNSSRVIAITSNTGTVTSPRFPSASTSASSMTIHVRSVHIAPFVLT
jgi:hypothetical protein